MNMVRLHQKVRTIFELAPQNSCACSTSRMYHTLPQTTPKVNNERWYYYTDTMGILVLQDMIQHYGDSVSKPDPALYWQDLEAMMTNL